MPALLTCPAASELAAPGGPEIDVSEVIRKNLERTRSQEGWFAEWAICIYIYKVFSFYTITYIYISSFIPACRILHMQRWWALPAAHRRWNRSRTPTSADWIQQNAFFLMPFSLFWLWGCFAYASWDCFETICRQGALAVKQSSQVETCHMSGLKFGTDHGLSQQIQAYPFFWPALMWKENKKHVMDPACRWMLKWSNNLSRCWPTRSTKAIEISSRFFWSFLIHMNVLIWARIYSSCNQAQGGQGTLKWLCYTLEIPRRETWASLHIVFSAGRNASDACSRCWEGWWCIHKHLYFLIFSLFMRLVQHKKNGKVRAVASVHRQAEKDPALSFRWTKSIFTCSFLQEQRPLLPVGVKLDQSLADQVKSMALNMPVDGDLVVQQDKAHGSFFSFSGKPITRISLNKNNPVTDLKTWTYIKVCKLCALINSCIMICQVLKNSRKRDEPDDHDADEDAEGNQEPEPKKPRRKAKAKAKAKAQTEKDIRIVLAHQSRLHKTC